MAPQTPSRSDGAFLLPTSYTADITDNDIAILSQFVFGSIEAERYPSEHPRRSLGRCKVADLSNGLLRGASGSKRSRSMLDALLAVCVCTNNQRLALSVSFGNSVRICIAQNDTKPPQSIHEHLTSIWQQLQALADLQNKLHRENGLSGITTDKQGISPESAESHISANDLCLKSLHCGIHKYCYLKTQKRVKKHMAGFISFYEYFLGKQGSLDDGDIIAAPLFYLAKIHKIVTKDEGPRGASGTPGPNWGRLAAMSSLLFYSYSINASNITNRIRYVMALWNGTPEVKSEHAPQFPWLLTYPYPDDKLLRSFNLEKALQKMLTLSSQIQELADFAYSPRLRPTLEKKLEVVLLEPIVVKRPEPSAQVMKDTVKRAFNALPFAAQALKDGPEAQNALEDILNDQLKFVQRTLAIPGPTTAAHAEYTLLVHHHRGGTKTPNPEFTPPFQYITVNKLSCFCCWSIYEAYSKITGRIFSLRRSNSKLCSPWWVTANNFAGAGDLPAALRRHLYTKLVYLYSSHLEQLRKTHSCRGGGAVALNGSRRLPVDANGEREAGS